MAGADGLVVLPQETPDPAKPAEADVQIVSDSGGRPQVKLQVRSEEPKDDKKPEPAATDKSQTDEPSRPVWLPEKFKTPNDLKDATVALLKQQGAPAYMIRGIESSESGQEVSDAYKEWEKKIDPNSGKPAEKPKEEAPKPEEKKEEPKPPVVKTDEIKAEERKVYGEAVAAVFDKAGIVGRDLGEEYARTGKVSEENYAKLEAAGFSRGIVDAFFRGAAANAHDLAEAHITEIKASVGGPDEFAKLSVWAASSMDKGDLDTYNAMVSSGNKAVAQKAVQWLKDAYAKANPTEPKLVGSTGKSSADGDVYGSWAEVQKDMSDARYRNGDPAFHRKVEEKLLRSKL